MLTGLDLGFSMGRCLLKALGGDRVQQEPHYTNEKPQKGRSGRRLYVGHSVVWPDLVPRLSGSLRPTAYLSTELFRQTRTPLSHTPAHLLSSDRRILSLSTSHAAPAPARNLQAGKDGTQASSSGTRHQSKEHTPGSGTTRAGEQEPGGGTQVLGPNTRKQHIPRS